MNKLTRKECEQACLYLLSHCYEVEHNGKEKYIFTPSGFGEADIFKLLIEEHFDNPPLKFEDLKEDMWVWDDKTKSYIYIFELLYWKPVNAIIYAGRIINDSAHGFCIDFEENRLYRREVQQ